MSLQIGTGARRCISGIFSNGGANATIKAARAELTQLAQQQHLPVEEESRKAHRFWTMFQSPVVVPVVEETPETTKTTLDTTTTMFEEEVHTMRLNVSGVDEAVLDSYTQFLKRAAAVVTPNMMCKIVPLVPPDSLLPSKSLHQSRMLLIHELRGEAGKFFLDYIEENKPEGVIISIEDKVQWK